MALPVEGPGKSLPRSHQKLVRQEGFEVPVFKSRVVIELTRRMRAFLNLNAGLTRGEAPDFERMFKQIQDKIKKQNRQLERMQGRLSNKDKNLEEVRRQSADRDQEIARLQKLSSRQSADSDQRIVGVRNQLREAERDGKADGEARGGTVSKAPTSALYLDLMKRCLADAIYGEDRGRARPSTNPLVAHTLIGLERLDNLQLCVEEALANDVPGDLIETGVWRGGATIFMRAILEAYGVEDRRVWVADSFEGFPPPDTERYPHDEGDRSYTVNPSVIPSLDQVKDNFERYGLLDDRVRFLKGWFRDTLPEAPMEKLAVVRLDGDMYESTMDALVHLYPKLSVGGYLIVDDYGCFPACRQAIHDYRESHGIKENIQSADWTGVFWQRLR